MVLSKKIKILFLWHPNSALKKYLQKGTAHLSQVELLFPPEELSKEQRKQWLLKKAKDVRIAIGWRPTDELLATAAQLQLFINPGAGVQHQIERFKKLNKTQNVTLVNGHGNAYFTAQHTVTLLLTLSNKVALHHQLLQKGQWRTGDKEGGFDTLARLYSRLVGLWSSQPIGTSFFVGF